MNLIDAIKSGRPIRRRMPHEAMRNLDHWICSKCMLDALSRGDMRPFSREDFLADDWEVQEPSVTITREIFAKALDEAFTANWKEVFAREEPQCCGRPPRIVIWNDRVLLRKMTEQAAHTLGLEP